jgi:acyl carrier protein phosphodiesterase
VNYLAHLWLSDVAGLPLAGAILGDLVRGRLDGRLPPELEQSIRLHRRVDAVTDRHPALDSLRQSFAPGARRYAGIVLDLVCDHVLARGWEQLAPGEALEAFAERAAADMHHHAAWFAAVDAPHPSRWRLPDLLLSYRSEAGIDRALQHTAKRLRQPQPLLEAGMQWRDTTAAVTEALSPLLRNLECEAQRFRAD